jgi:hypothetical protein
MNTTDVGKTLTALMLVAINNRQGLLNGLDGTRTTIDDCLDCMDAPNALPSGSMQSWTSIVFPVVQGVAYREEN